MHKIFFLKKITEQEKTDYQNDMFNNNTKLTNEVSGMG